MLGRSSAYVLYIYAIYLGKERSRSPPSSPFFSRLSVAATTLTTNVLQVVTTVAAAATTATASSLPPPSPLSKVCLSALTLLAAQCSSILSSIRTYSGGGGGSDGVLHFISYRSLAVHPSARRPARQSVQQRRQHFINRREVEKERPVAASLPHQTSKRVEKRGDRLNTICALQIFGNTLDPAFALLTSVKRERTRLSALTTDEDLDDFPNAQLH
jgi:hypothetical protein